GRGLRTLRRAGRHSRTGGGPLMGRIGVITFPGSLEDRDAARAVRLAGAEPVRLWHASDSLARLNSVVLPGGCSYGDYLRAGALSSFATIRASLGDAANTGLPVLGICNGFQILCETHLLAGAMIKNTRLTFVCTDQVLRVENTR